MISLWWGKAWVYNDNKQEGCGGRVDTCFQKNVKYQVVNVERMLVLRNHYFVAITITVGSGQNHKWGLNLGAEVPALYRKTCTWQNAPIIGGVWRVGTNLYTCVAATQIKGQIFSITSNMPTCPFAVNTPHTSSLRQPPICFPSSDMSFPSLEFHITGTIHHRFCGPWLLSWNIMVLRFIYSVAHIRTLFLLMAELYSMAWICHNL